MNEFPVTIDIEVRFRDMDAFAHVDNVVYYEYFEMARVAYLDRIGMPIPGPAWHDFGWVIGSSSCRYKAAVVFPDLLKVGARVAAMSDDRVLMEYEVFSTSLGRTAVEGQALLVAYDFHTGRPISIKEPVRSAILRLEGGALPKVPRGTGRIVPPFS